MSPKLMVVSVFAGVGESTREGNDLYREMIDSGVIKLGEKQSESKCALVYGQMNEPPGGRARVGHIDLTVAEHFRDAEGQDVLLFINIFHFTQANSEVSALLVVGYQPTLATALGGALDDPSFPSLLKQLVGPPISQLSDRRSSIVKQSCHLLSYLSRNF